MSSKAYLIIGTFLMSISAASFAQKDAVGPILVNADTINVNGNGHRKTFPCNGRKLVVDGSDHVVKTTGVCSHVQVYGAKNQIEATIAPNGTLEVGGSEHIIRWKSSGEPTQDLSGIDNKITRVK